MRITEDFIGELVHNNVEDFLRYISKLSRDPDTKWDILIEATQRALRANPEIPVYYPKTWFTTIVKNVIFDRHRRKKKNSITTMNIDYALELGTTEAIDSIESFIVIDEVLKVLQHYLNEKQFLALLNYLNEGNIRDSGSYFCMRVRPALRKLYEEDMLPIVFN